MADVNVEVLVGDELYIITMSADEHKEVVNGSKLIIGNL